MKTGNWEVVSPPGGFTLYLLSREISAIELLVLCTRVQSCLFFDKPLKPSEIQGPWERDHVLARDRSIKSTYVLSVKSSERSPR